MKKYLFLYSFFFLFFSFLSQAQVGINTTNPQAGLHIVASNDTLPIIRVDSIGINKALFYVDSVGNVGVHTVPTARLHVKDGLTLRGLLDKTQDTVAYNHVLAVRYSNNGSDSIGDIQRIPIKNYFLTEKPNIRSVKYTFKSIRLDAPDFDSDSTITQLGSFSIRYVTNNGGSFGSHFQFKVNKPTYFSIYLKKAGGGTRGEYNQTNREMRYYTNYSRNAAPANTWITLPGNEFVATLRDIGSALILLNNLKEIYRVTFNANGSGFYNPNPDNIAKPSPQITIFLEQVVNEL